MQWKNIFTVMFVALITMVFTLTWFGPMQAGAEDDEAAVRTRIQNPKLSVDGLNVTLKTDKENYKPGEKPKLTLEAVNPTDKAVTTRVYLAYSVLLPRNPGSRVPNLPEVIWTGETPLTLGPGESKSFEKNPDMALSSEYVVNINMGTDERSLVSMPFRMGGPGDGTFPPGGGPVAPPVVPESKNSKVSRKAKK